MNAAIKTKIFRAAVAVSTLAVLLETVGAPRKWL